MEPYMYWVLVNMLDYLTTRYAVSRGYGEEANPIAKWFMNRFGVDKGLLALKTLMFIPLLFMPDETYMWIYNLVVTGVCAWNIVQILIAMRKKG